MVRVGERGRRRQGGAEGRPMSWPPPSARRTGRAPHACIIVASGSTVSAHVSLPKGLGAPPRGLQLACAHRTPRAHSLPRGAVYSQARSDGGRGRGGRTGLGCGWRGSASDGSTHRSRRSLRPLPTLPRTHRTCPWTHPSLHVGAVSRLHSDCGGLPSRHRSTDVRSVSLFCMLCVSLWTSARWPLPVAGRATESSLGGSIARTCTCGAGARRGAVVGVARCLW